MSAAPFFLSKTPRARFSGSPRRSEIRNILPVRRSPVTRDVFWFGASLFLIDFSAPLSSGKFLYAISSLL
jgi:hypothetical protein